MQGGESKGVRVSEIFLRLDCCLLERMATGPDSTNLDSILPIACQIHSVIKINDIRHFVVGN